ncbi:Exosome complex component rrp40 [Cucumispora dikerogammari]|nr:Exosome complex component rrp40 [Cucumispora dikerogammari]
MKHSTSSTMSSDDTTLLSLKNPQASTQSNLTNLTTHKIYISQNPYTLTTTSIYTPVLHDTIICRIFYCSGSYYKLDLFACSTHTAVLNVMSFNNTVSKRSRPKLNLNDIVICRVVTVSEIDLLVTCEGEGLGPLPVFDYSNNIKEKITNAGFILQSTPYKCKLLYLTDTLINISKNYNYEICIGLNGVIWINCNVKDIKGIGRLLL